VTEVHIVDSQSVFPTYIFADQDDLPKFVPCIVIVFTTLDIGMLRLFPSASMALIEGTSNEKNCELDPTDIPVVTINVLDIDIPTLTAAEIDVVEIHEVAVVPDFIKRTDPVESKAPRATPFASTCTASAVGAFATVALIAGKSKDSTSELLPMLPAAVTMIRNVARKLASIT
jgi:hypothetical protein